MQQADLRVLPAVGHRRADLESRLADPPLANDAFVFIIVVTANDARGLCFGVHEVIHEPPPRTGVISLRMS